MDTMVAVFSRVSVDISAEFIENFPVQFDFKGMLKRICDDVEVSVSIIGDSYNLDGQWNTIGKAHNMLVSTLAVYGSSNLVRQEQEGVLSHGSRPFSALVEAAEAISRGVELQEQVQKEMMDMEHIPDHEFGDFQTENVSQTCITDVNSVIKKELAFGKTCSRDVKATTDLDLPNASSDAYNNIFYEDGHGIRNFTNPEYEVNDNNPQTNAAIITTDSLPEQPNEIIDKIRSSQNDFRHTYNDADVQEKSLTFESAIDDIPQNQRTEISDTQSSKKVPSKKKNAEIPCNQILKSKKAKTYPCNKCDFEGKTSNAIADHRRRVHKAEPTKCDICTKVFPNARYMKRHRYSHSEPKHKCEICGKRYKVLKALREHTKRHDKAYIKPEFKCEQCPKSFCSSYVLECHIKSEHMGIKRCFLCQTCGKSFSTKHTLQQHVNVHIGIRPYKCMECDKTFCYESALRDHSNIHEGTKKFLCGFPNCNKAFRQRSAFKMHEKIHKEVKDFKCPTCDRGFTQKQALQRHMRAHQNLKPFSCKFCLRKFGEASVIRRHLILVHKVSKDPSTWREDIISQPIAKESTTVKKVQASDRPRLDHVVTVVGHESINDYIPVDNSVHSNVRLPPVTDIHNFRPIESYTHELENADPEGVDHEQPPNITGQMNYTVPSHHDYAHTTQVSSSQYNYTATPLEFTLDSNIKTRPQLDGESHKAESLKIHPYEQSLVQIEEQQPDNSHNEKSSTMQYLQQTAADNTYTVIDVGKLGKTFEVLTKSNAADTVSGNVSVSSLEQTRPSVESVVTKDIVDGRTNETAESLESVNMSQFYTYYSNLASQYVNIGQYNILPSAETSDHLT